MGSWIRANRAFCVFSVTLLASIGLATALWTAFGEGWVAAAYRGESLAVFNRMIPRPPDGPVGAYVMRVDSVLTATLTGALGLYGLWVLVYLIWRTPLRLRYGLVLVLVYYLGFERFAAPHLLVPLRLQNYYWIKDPDHRPKSTNRAAGWNSDSIRCRFEASEFGPEGMNLVFLGDSFTFGMKLPPEDSFPNKVERFLIGAFPELDLKVANLGWNSSSPLLSYRRLSDIGARYHPDFVVLCLDMTDFRDDIKWNNMIERRGIYWLYDKIPITLKLLEKLLPGLFWKVYYASNDNMPAERFFASEAPLEETRPYLQPLVENLARIEGWCLEHDAEFVLMVLPRSYQYSDRECPQNWEAEHYTVLGPYSHEPFRFFEELRPEVDYPIHSLLETFRDTEVFPTCFDDDPHWTPAGTSVAAEAIARILKVEIDERLAPAGSGAR